MHLPRKLNKPDLLPGCCSRCRASENRQFYMDVGFQTYDEPGIYLCDQCIVDIIKEDGRFVLVTELEKAKKNFDEQVDRLLKTHGKYDKLMEHLGDIVNGKSAIDGNDGSASNADQQPSDGNIRPADFAKDYTLKLT